MWIDIGCSTIPAPTPQDGICFLETANLDGETNLKQRRVYIDVSQVIISAKIPGLTTFHFG